MRIRWLSIGLGVSVLLNIVLAVGWFGQVVSEGVLAADTGSTFRHMRAEADELRALRGRFCTGGAAPTATDVERWAIAGGANPHREEGYLWLHNVGVRIADEDQITGICLPQTWQATAEDRPPPAPDEGDFERCELQPFC